MADPAPNIRPRRSKPAAVRNTQTKLGAHPMLAPGSVYFMVYSWLLLNPKSTRNQIKRALGVNHQRVSDMVDNGLLREVGTVGREALLEVVSENSTGLGRDRVEVEVTVSVNAFGEFSCTSRLIGEVPGAREGNPRPVARKRYTVMVPKPEEGYEVRRADAPVITLPAAATRVIDAEFEMVQGAGDAEDDGKTP